VLSYYQGSPMYALLSVYPEFDWIIWKFNRVPMGFWKDKTNHKKFFDWLGKQLEFKSLEHWYNITKLDINKHGGSDFLNTTMVL